MRREPRLEIESLSPAFAAAPSVYAYVYYGIARAGPD